MKTIAILQQKGGVGKTTLTFNLAACIAKDGYSVELLDTDHQGSLREYGGVLAGVTLLPDGQTPSEQANVLLIDTSPRNDTGLTSILALADFVLVPLMHSYPDLSATMGTIAILGEHGYPLNRVLVVLNRVSTNPRSGMVKEIDPLIPDLGLPVAKTRIYDREAYKRSVYEARGVFDMTDKKAQSEIQALTDELLDLL